MVHRIRLKVNGADHDLEVPARRMLVDCLRYDLGLTGTKEGCSVGVCGACTVLVDGQMVASCITLAVTADGADITTVEGLAQDGKLHPVQQAWIDHQVPQCGYCQSGMIMAISALLEGRPDATDEQVAASITNICRCGTYERIRSAIRSLDSAEDLEEETGDV